MNKFILLFILLGCLGLNACSEDEQVASVKIISLEAGGVTLTNNLSGVPVDTEISLVFDASVSESALREHLILTTGNTIVTYDLTLTNASSKVTIVPQLDFDTEYTLVIAQSAIGSQGEVLESTVDVTFTTEADALITEANPCTSTASCLYTRQFVTTQGVASLDYYASYDIYEENASWQKLTSALIVIHGANRNADDYYSYVMNTLRDKSQEGSTILISPHFKDTGEAATGELGWSSNAWREGQNSAGEVKLSSFSVLDSLISQLSDETLFPALKQIIITGHSSGGLFTHVYATANTKDISTSNKDIHYVVANSQYFYYPDGLRYDEAGDNYYEPTGCALYDSWPMGAKNLPPYLTGTLQADLNERFLNRNIIYLLGNGTAADPTLNTTDCSATLLGSSRFHRGENSFRHTNDHYPGHAHQQVVVSGIGHDGQGMYQSQTFKNLLTELLD